MSRHVAASVAFVLFAVAPGLVAGARAQELTGESRLTFVSAAAQPAWAPLDSLASQVAQLPLEVGQTPVPIVQPYRHIETGGPSPLMMSLYVSTAMTQALDVHSTLLALDRGGIETNPMLSGLTGNKAAFIAVKGAVAAASIFAAHRLAKRNKVAAIVSLVAMNAAYGLVASHNYQVARRLQ